MSDKTCPVCGKESPFYLANCECGYEFKSEARVYAEASAVSSAPKPGANWTLTGWAVSIAGAIGLVASLVMETSVETYDLGAGSGSVVNLGLLFNKGVAVACSISGIGIGVVCLAVGAIIASIHSRVD